MSSVGIGLMGFGRIGRNLFRILYQSEDIRLRAISDIIGNPHSCIFDALSTSSLQDGYLRVVSWYDNEWGYSNRVVDLIDKLKGLGF